MRIRGWERSLRPAKDALQEELGHRCPEGTLGSQTCAHERSGELGDLAAPHLCQVVLQADSGDHNLWGQNISGPLPGPRVLTSRSNYPFLVSSRGPTTRSPAVNRQQKLISPGQRGAGLRILLPWQLLQVFLKGMTRPRGSGCFSLPFPKSKSKKGHRVREAA